MKRRHLFQLTILVACALPLAAIADGRECVIDPDTGMLVPENGSGACFGDAGFSVALVDGDGEFVFAANAPDDNQFGRLNPNGRARFHTSQKDAFIVYCSSETFASGNCNPFSGESFEGIGRVKLNSDLDDQFFYTCPATGKINGIGVDAHDNAVEFSVKFAVVPDPDTVCRFSLLKIDATPVVD